MLTLNCGDIIVECSVTSTVLYTVNTVLWKYNIFFYCGYIIMLIVYCGDMIVLILYCEYVMLTLYCGDMILLILYCEDVSMLTLY